MKIIEANKPNLNKGTYELLVRALTDTIREFYEDPENVKKFEEWEAQQTEVDK